MKNGLPNIRLAKSSRTGLVKKGYLLLGLVFVVKGRSHLMNREMQVFLHIWPVLELKLWNILHKESV